MGYDAFISYSHESDAALAEGIQQGLQRFAKPWHRRRALDVFRDSTGLSANPGLWTSITDVMAESRYLVVVCSPHAAASPWVSREIDHWRATKPEGRIIPVLADGELAWDDATGRFDPVRSTAAPAAFAAAFSEEPLYVDMRWADQPEHRSLDNPGFRDDIADIAAPMHGVAKDELIGEDIHQHRRTLRYAWGAVGAVLLLAAATVVGATIAVGKADEAQRRADEVLVANKSLSQARNLRDRADDDRRSAVKGRRAAERARAQFERDAEVSRVAARNADATAQEKTAAALAASALADQQAALAESARGEAARAGEQQRAAEQGRDQATNQRDQASRDRDEARARATQFADAATRAERTRDQANIDRNTAVVAANAARDAQVVAEGKAADANADARASGLAAAANQSDLLASSLDLSLLLANAATQQTAAPVAKVGANAAASAAGTGPSRTALGALLTSTQTAGDGILRYLRFPTGQRPHQLKTSATSPGGRIAAAETNSSIELGTLAARLYVWLDPGAPAVELSSRLPAGQRLGCVNELHWDASGRFLLTVEDPFGCLNPDLEPAVPGYAYRTIRLWQVDVTAGEDAVTSVPNALSPIGLSPLKIDHGLALLQLGGGVIVLELETGAVHQIPGFFLASAVYDGQDFTADGERIIGVTLDLFTGNPVPALSTREGQLISLSDPDAGIVVKADPFGDVVGVSMASVKYFDGASGAEIGERTRTFDGLVAGVAVARVPMGGVTRDVALVSVCDDDGCFTREALVAVDVTAPASAPLWTANIDRSSIPGAVLGPSSFTPGGRLATVEWYAPHDLDDGSAPQTILLDAVTGAVRVQTVGRPVAFSTPDERYVAVQERDVQESQTTTESRVSVRAMVWDVAQRTAVGDPGVLIRSERNVDLASVPDGRSVLAYATTAPLFTTSARPISVWGLDDATVDSDPRILPGSKGATSPVADVNGNVVAMVGGAGNVVMWDPDLRPYTLLGDESPTPGLRSAMSPDARVWAVSNDARSVALRPFDPSGSPGADVAVPALPLEPDEQIQNLTFSRDTRLLFANLAGEAGLATATVAIRVERSGGQVSVGTIERLDAEEALTSSTDGTRIAFRSLDAQLDPPHSEVVVRDATSLGVAWRARTIRLPDDGLEFPEDVFALDGNGTHLAGTNQSGRIVVWREAGAGATPGRLFAPDLGEVDPRNPRYGIAFSPDGAHFAANGPDRRLRLFDLGTSGDDAVRTRPLPSETANRVRYSDDGSTILVDGIVLLDGETLNQIGPRLHPSTWTNQVDRGTQATFFTPDGRYLVAERVDGSQVARYEVGLDGLRATACRLAGRNLTPEEQGAFETGPGSGTMCSSFPADGG